MAVITPAAHGILKNVFGNIKTARVPITPPNICRSSWHIVRRATASRRLTGGKNRFRAGAGRKSRR
jgi:hypothetical protein